MESKVISLSFTPLRHQLLLSFPAPCIPIAYSTGLQGSVRFTQRLNRHRAECSLCDRHWARSFCIWHKNPGNRIHSTHLTVVKTDWEPLSNLSKGPAHLVAQSEFGIQAPRFKSPPNQQSISKVPEDSGSWSKIHTCHKFRSSNTHTCTLTCTHS